MSIKQIKLSFTDKRTYFILATFFDREDVLSDIEEARNILKDIDNLDGGENIYNSIFKKYNRPFNFRSAIHSAIVRGSVDERYFTPHPYLLLAENININLDTTETAIVVSPDTTEEQLREIFNLIVKENYKEFFHYDSLSKQNIGYDTRGNIVRDRSWYWQKKTGKTYAQITRSANSFGFNITQKGIETAIKNYRKLLKRAF